MRGRYPSEDIILRVRRTLLGELLYNVMLWNPEDGRYYIQTETNDLAEAERQAKALEKELSRQKIQARQKKLSRKREETENGDQIRGF